MEADRLVLERLTTGNVAVQVGALPYAGQLNFNIVADANLVPDLTVFANGMIEDLERLGAHERQ